MSFIQYKSFSLLIGCFRSTADGFPPSSRNAGLMENQTQPRQYSIFIPQATQIYSPN